MEMRPRQYQHAKPALTTDQKVVRLERTTAAQADLIEGQGVIIVDHGAAIDMLTETVTDLTATVDTIASTVDGLPDTSSIWSDARPTATFGAGTDLTWTATGNGAATTYSIPGRISTAATRYVVIVGGVRQAPGSYSLSTSAATLTFTEAPPSGVAVSIHAPFYGSAPP